MSEPQIPGFTIRKRIGKGGMAVVYLAADETGREVALKVIDGSQGNAAVVFGQFAQEAGIIGRLRHPSIVKIYRAGQHEHWFYLVCEYLPGGDLKARIRAGITVDDALELTRKLTGALDVAHEANLVHRDVKPENVLFRANGTPVLMDFGIAAASGHLRGTMAGTPMYMSPEQVNAREIDRRTDIYSLGCVLFEMLTGAPPYPLASMEAILYAQVHKPVPTLPPQLHELQGLIDAMMCKDVAERIGSGKELLRALDDYWLLAPRAGGTAVGKVTRPQQGDTQNASAEAQRTAHVAAAAAPADSAAGRYRPDLGTAGAAAAHKAAALQELEQARNDHLRSQPIELARKLEESARAAAETLSWQESYELARDYLKRGEIAQGTELLSMIALAAPGEVAEVARQMLYQLSH